MRQKRMALVVFVAWMAPAPAAWALDGYQDRKGGFAGGGVGGGGGSTDADDVAGGEGAGPFVMARVGGGLGDGLTMDLSYGWFTRDKVGHGLMAASANIFVTEQVFVRLGAGLGRGRVTDGEGDTLVEDFSLGLLGGGGVEFFLNSNLAAGLTVQLQRHLMSAVRYTGLHAVAGVTWY